MARRRRSAGVGVPASGTTYGPQQLAKKKREVVGMLTKPQKRVESQCREVDGEVKRRRPVGGCGAVEDVLFRAS